MNPSGDGDFAQRATTKTWQQNIVKVGDGSIPQCCQTFWPSFLNNCSEFPLKKLEVMRRKHNDMQRQHRRQCQTNGDYNFI